jgi:hypothetical protein
VVDDVHGTVLGVTDPIRTPRHDPPPRLRGLVEAMEPVCVFPGCRRIARQCDIDHRIPYDPHDPQGERGGGATCSCNLQPLCRAHHQQKTAGRLTVRALTRAEDSTAPPGTLLWTLPSGITCRSHPYIAAPTPVPGAGPRVAAGVAADVAAAVEHLTEQRARARAHRHPDVHRDVDPDPSGRDPRGESWQRSRQDAATARARRRDRAGAQARVAADVADRPPW